MTSTTTTAPYSIAKRLELRERYITSTMISVDVLGSLHLVGTGQKSLNFLELYAEVDGNSSVQCISYHSCCIHLEYSTPRLYSAFQGCNRPTTADSFAWGPVQMDLHSSAIIVKVCFYLSIACTTKHINSCKWRYIRYT